MHWLHIICLNIYNFVNVFLQNGFIWAANILYLTYWPYGQYNRYKCLLQWALLVCHICGSSLSHLTSTVCNRIFVYVSATGISNVITQWLFALTLPRSLVRLIGVAWVKILRGANNGAARILFRGDIQQKII